MSRKAKPKINEVKNNNVDSPLYVGINTQNSKNIAKACVGTKGANSIYRAAGYNTHQDIITGVSIRDDYNFQDYQNYRPSETIPVERKAVGKACNRAYKKIGIVKNVIDLMADFACQGIDLVHPNPTIEKFYRAWGVRVGFVERSERFLNIFYRLGNVVVKRSTAKITLKDRENMERGLAAPDVIPKPVPKYAKNEIPWEYHFINPSIVDIVSEDLSLFSGVTKYQITLPDVLTRKIKELNKVDDFDKEIIESIPQDIRQGIKSGSKTVPLDPDKVEVFHYKKDDWESWASPMIYSILSELMTYEKMQMADLNALDGAVSRIRLWTMGYLDGPNSILPTPAAYAKLNNILMAMQGNGGVLDVIWDATLKCEEISTDVNKFLGLAKYEPVLQAIFAGLGVPPTLTGASTASGFTNNYISLKTLVERLNYGRRVLREFWQKEIAIVQKAMGFRFPAQLNFERMTLSDEAAEKALLLQLIDRNLVSREAVLKHFGEVPALEQTRMQREAKLQEAGKLPDKANPLKSPDVAHKQDLEKIKLQSQLKPKPAPAALPGKPGQGRPKTSKDSTKRKTKKVKPRTSAKLALGVWLKDSQEKLSEMMNKSFLTSVSKSNLRKLTEKEFIKLEELKFVALASLPKWTIPVNEHISGVLSSDSKIKIGYVKILNKAKAIYKNKFGQEPPIEYMRDMQIQLLSRRKMWPK